MLRFSKVMWSFVVLALLVCGCQESGKQNSELFRDIVKPEKGGLFRGVEMDMPLDKVKSLEGQEPRHDDQWGYVYKFELGDDQHAFVEYINKDKSSRVVNSIVANVMLESEQDASTLYAEMETWLRGKYGVGDGVLGRLKWKHEESNLYVTLRMLRDKKSLSLTIVPATGY